MVVPSIFLGCEVTVKTKRMNVCEINHREQTFKAEFYDGTIRIETVCPMSEYKPFPSMQNLLMGLSDWDMYYSQSDDIRYVEKEQEREKALKEALNGLQEKDKFLLKKLLEIIKL